MWSASVRHGRNSDKRVEGVLGKEVMLVPELQTVLPGALCSSISISKCEMCLLAATRALSGVLGPLQTSLPSQQPPPHNQPCPQGRNCLPAAG